MVLRRSVTLGYGFEPMNPYLALTDMAVKRAVDTGFLKAIEEMYPRSIRAEWVNQTIEREYVSTDDVRNDMAKRLVELSQRNPIFTFALTTDPIVCRYLIIDGEHRLFYTQGVEVQKSMGSPSRQITSTYNKVVYHANLELTESWEHTIPAACCTDKDDFLDWLARRQHDVATAAGKFHGAPDHVTVDGEVVEIYGAPLT